MRANARFASRDVPGGCMVTGLLTPVLLVLLCITFVGIAAVPFVVAALFFTSLFGKAVALAWLGHRAVGARGAERLGHPPSPCSWAGPSCWSCTWFRCSVRRLQVAGIVRRGRGGLHVGAARARTARSPRGSSESRRIPEYCGTPNWRGIAKSRNRAESGGRTQSRGAPGRSSRPWRRSSRPRRRSSRPRRRGSRPRRRGSRPGVAAPVISAAGLPRAGFWIRMVALMLDALLVGS